MNNELALNFDFSYQKLFYRNKTRNFDLSGTSTLLIGNTFSGAHAGLLLRFGKLNSFYESTLTNSRIKNNTHDQKKAPLEFFIFTCPQFYFAAYDATIQGGLFRTDKGPVTFGIQHGVYTQQIGLNFAASRFNAKYVVTLKTKEVKSKAKAYQYESISFSYNLR